MPSLEKTKFDLLFSVLNKHLLLVQHECFFYQQPILIDSQKFFTNSKIKIKKFFKSVFKVFSLGAFLRKVNKVISGTDVGIGLY